MLRTTGATIINPTGGVQIKLPSAETWSSHTQDFRRSIHDGHVEGKRLVVIEIERHSDRMIYAATGSNAQDAFDAIQKTKVPDVNRTVEEFRAILNQNVGSLKT